MDNGTVYEILKQAKTSDVSEAFRSYLRVATRQMLIDVMSEEVSLLCGRRQHPLPDAEYVRAGSAEGYAYIDTHREQIKRPRVRRQGDEGTSSEVSLSSYKLSQDKSELERQILSSLIAVGSQKKVAKSFNKQRGSSASEVSRLFHKHGKECFSQLRSRRLDCDQDGNSYDWFCLTIDGVVLAKELVAVVAVGIKSNGEKMVLDFEIGSSESFEITSNLLSRIKERGFAPPESRNLLAILDGSPALSKAVLRHFPLALIQRCLVHKERNLKSYLSKKDWADMFELTDRLRKSQGAQAAVLAYNELDSFLAVKNTAARQSLHEAGLDLLTLHFLEAPATLNRNLLSTNMIENVILNFRTSSKHVCRWRSNTYQGCRWLATGLLEAEKGFNRLSGYRDLPSLIRNLSNDTYRRSLEEFGHQLPEDLADLASASLRAAPSAPQMPNLSLTSVKT